MEEQEQQCISRMCDMIDSQKFPVFSSIDGVTIVEMKPLKDIVKDNPEFFESSLGLQIQ